MAEDTKRTHIAAMGVGMADLFTHSLSLQRVGGFEPVLREPASNSTGGGRQALQHIVLQPPSASESVITVGSVNVATKEAKIRTYDCLAALHERRFPDRPFPVPRDEYDPFFTALRRFIESQRMRLDIEGQPPAIESPSAASRGSPNLLVALLVTIVVAAGMFLALR